MDYTPPVLPPLRLFLKNLRFIAWLIVHPAMWETYRLAVPLLEPVAATPLDPERITLVLLGPGGHDAKSIVTIHASKRPDVFVRRHGQQAEYFRFRGTDKYGRYAYVQDAS